MILNIISAVTAVIAVLVSLWAVLYARGKDDKTESMEAIRAVIRDMIAPLSSAADRNTLAIGEIEKRVAPTLLTTTDRLNVMSDRVGVLETKIDVFWKDVACFITLARVRLSPQRRRVSAIRNDTV